MRLRDACGRFTRPPRRVRFDLVGKAFHWLTVIRLAGKKIGKAIRLLWLCRCKCGKRVVVNTNALRTGNTKSCGCRKRLATITCNKERALHNMSHTPTFISWQAMHARCRAKRDTSHPDHRNYFAAGVRVSKRWNVFTNFLADMGTRPRRTTLGRINDAGNYSPANVRWMKRSQQEAAKKAKRRRRCL